MIYYPIIDNPQIIIEYFVLYYLSKTIFIIKYAKNHKPYKIVIIIILIILFGRIKLSTKLIMNAFI